MAKSPSQGSIEGGNGILNRNTGVVDGKFLLFGGRRFYESQSRVHHRGRSPQPLSIVEVTAAGTGIFPRVDLLDPTEAFAAWDDRQLIATQEMPSRTSINGAIKHSAILCWDLAKTVSLARAERVEAANIKSYADQVKWNATVDSKRSWRELRNCPCTNGYWTRTAIMQWRFAPMRSSRRMA